MAGYSLFWVMHPGGFLRQIFHAETRELNHECRFSPFAENTDSGEFSREEGQEFFCLVEVAWGNKGDSSFAYATTCMIFLPDIRYYTARMLYKR